MLIAAVGVLTEAFKVGPVAVTAIVCPEALATCTSVLALAPNVMIATELFNSDARLM